MVRALPCHGRGRGFESRRSRLYTVYILQSTIDSKYYIGVTRDLTKRIQEHNQGKTRSLRNRIPLNLVYSEDYLDRHEAYIRERQIKSYKGGNSFKKLINDTVG